MGKVVAMDHIVLRSPEIERSLAFYCDVLGMEGMRLDEWRAGDVRFPSVQVAPGTIIDFFPLEGEAAEQQQLDHFCLVVEPGTLEQVLAAVESFGLAPGPLQSRWGARGRGTSSYLESPEGVTLELRQYE